ncbi:InlB B-repeat-containing protein [Bacillus sp. FJAT-49736]|uniref:InlB B-repeat-containing protein n=1 Tax=Bacillus sp. FJAT-49736 TaxID=2833582 RepID=UPI001BC94AAC|nr:InlB B-repeat-containing protein [Bacillus sp. FJAT-49736]MBS4174270.1 InlB B-repeat-containing protein [Bacillus sp. FJAT-49736]
MNSLFRNMKWVTIVCMVIYILNPIASIFTSVKAYATASTPRSENFESASADIGKSNPQMVGDWTFSFPNNNSNQNKTQIKSALAPNVTNDLYFAGFASTGATDYALVHSNTGAFKLNSFKVIERNSPSDQYTIQGYLSGQPVQDAKLTFTPPSRDFYTVDVASNPAWQNIDEFRIYAKTTIKIEIDDLTVSDPVVSSNGNDANPPISNTWKVYQSNEVDGGFYDIAYDGNKWLAISSHLSDFGGGAIYSLNSDHTWTKQTINFTPDLNYTRSFTGLYYSGDKWVLTGNQQGIGGSDAFVATSSDGINWSVQNPVILHNSHGQGNFFSAASHGNTYVVVGGVNSKVDGKIYTSTDGGINWTNTLDNSNICLYKVIYVGDHFVAIGNQGAIYNSTDGVNWSKAYINDPVEFYDISYGNNQYIAVSGDGVIEKSNDGIHWSSSSANTPMYSIAYANGEFVAIGEDAFYSSHDGEDWTSENSDPLGIPNSNEFMNSVSYGNGVFIAVGANGISAVRQSTITASVPTVTTSQPLDITTTGATVGGNVTSDGNTSITERGIVYSSNLNPTIIDKKVTTEGNIGDFTAKLTGLDASTTYHYRAYATNSQGTSYGENQTFTTFPLGKFNQATTVAEMQEAMETYPEYAFYKHEGSSGFFAELKNDKEFVYKYMLENRPQGGFPNQQTVRDICSKGIDVRTIYMMLHDLRDYTALEFALMFPDDFDFGIDLSVLKTFVNDSDYTEVDAIAEKLVDRIPEDGFIGPVDLQKALDECIQEYLKESVENDKQNLEITFATGDDENHVTKNISLPTKGEKGSDISWTSSDLEAVGNDGTVSASQENKVVTLTATITRGTQTVTKTFTITVLAMLINHYTVSFNTNQGSDIPSISVKENGTVTKPTDPVKEGYTFDGWYTDINFLSAYDFNQEVTSNLNLVAKWKINNYTVTFDSNGGSTVTNKIAEYNTKISAPEVPTRTGYSFVNWFKDREFTQVWKFNTDKVTNDTTLYAKWEKQSYTVHFDTNGGSNVTDETVEYHEKATKPTDPVKEGYTFDGWYTDINFLSVYDFNQEVTSTLNLVAKWKINNYTVTFDSNGGSTVTNKIAEYNTKISAPEVPTRTGYSFVNWFKDREFTQVWKFNTDKVTNDTTLYAKWQSSDATLSKLELSNNATISPAFDAEKANYTANVGYSTTSLTVTPTKSNTNATITVNGKLSDTTVDLQVGENIITIMVTAQDGIVSKTYTITVYRAAAPSPSPGPSNPSEGSTRVVDVTVGQGQNGTAATVEIVRKIENGVKVDEVNFDESKAQEVVQKAIAQKQDISTIILTDLPQDIADEMKVNVLKKSLGQLGDNHIALQIQTPSATVSLPKDTVQSLNELGNDLYFRVVPIRKEADQQKTIQETLSSDAVKNAVGDKTKDIHVYGNPVTIETNYSNYKTNVLFPLKDLSLPLNPSARKAFLNTLRVYVKHTDGTEELLNGEVVTDKKGVPISLKIQINKFSTFTVLGVPSTENVNTAPLAKHVTISGSKVVGSVLKGTYKYEDADRDTQGKSLFQWYRADNSKGLNKQVIKGAVHSTYKLTANDTGKYIGFEVTPVASKGNKNGKPVVSIFIGKIVSKNTAPSVSGVKILGETAVGKTLHVTYKYQDAEGDKEGKTIINWYRVINGKKQLIKGAHKTSYTLTAKDVLNRLVVEVTPIPKTGVKTGVKKVSTTSKAIKQEQYMGHLDLGVIRSKSYVESIGAILKTKYNGLVIIKKAGSYYKLSADFKTKKEAIRVARELKKKKLIINYSIR